jgi:outer membrane protein TolC
VRRFDFPEYAFGFSFSVPLNNASARADSTRARLEQKQDEVALQQTRNRIALEVRKALIGLVQAKAQVAAAREAASLSARTLAAEETRLQSGYSTSYDVVRRQRDLLAAQLAEVQARASYAKALVELRRSTGALDK